MTISKKYPQTFKKQHNNRQQRAPNHNRTFPYVSSFFKPKPVLGVFINQRILLPKRYIAYIRKIVRKFFKKRCVKCWFRVQLNRTVSSKSKNSRMGKGVGTINRSGFLCKPSIPVLVLENISKHRLEILVIKLRARLGVSMRIQII